MRRVSVLRARRDRDGAADRIAATARIDAPPGAVYAGRVRLSDRKIESLATKIVRWMEQNSDIEFLAPIADVRSAIVEEFMHEKERERQLDDEVDRILQQNESRMRVEGVDSWVMRKKIRQELARQRGIVL